MRRGVSRGRRVARAHWACQPVGWWSLLRVHVANKNNEGAIEALTKLEDDFGHTLNRDAFKRDRSFAAFVASSEFQAWSAERHTEGGE